MGEDWAYRRMESAMNDAVDMALEIEQDRGVSLPPQIVGQAGMQMFQARLAIMMSSEDVDGLFDDPTDRETGGMYG